MLHSPRIPKESPNGSLSDLTVDVEPVNDAVQGKKPKLRGRPGNRNAREYAFYSQAFNWTHIPRLVDASDLSDFRPEIAGLRVKLIALLEDPDSSLEIILRTITAIATFVDFQHRQGHGRK